MNKVTKYVLVGSMVGVILTSFAGCSVSDNQYTDEQTTAVVQEVKEGKGLPEYYNCYNILEKNEIDDKYQIKSFTFAKPDANFIDELVSHQVSTEDAKMVLNTMNSDPNRVEEFVAGKGMDILTYDESSFLIKTVVDGVNKYGLFILNNTEGKVVVFNDYDINYSNENNIILYSNSKNEIAICNKNTGELIILDDVVYLDYNNDIIQFVRLSDNEYIYNYDTKNTKEQKLKVDNLKVQANYVSYTTSNEAFHWFDLLAKQKNTKALGGENFWIKLADESIVYVKKDGSQQRYQRLYTIKEGSLDGDFCIIQGLNTYSDITNGEIAYTSYKHSFYFNKKLDRIYEMPYFVKLSDINIEEGYIKYIKIDESEVFLDLSTGKVHYLREVVLTDDYKIYNTYGITQEGIYSLFKDNNGKTVLELDCKFTDGVKKYYDEEQIALCSYKLSNDDSTYFDPYLIKFDNIENPEIIKTFGYPDVLFETPVDKIFKVKYISPNGKKEALIDINGNMITDKVDVVYFEKEDSNSEELIYTVYLGTKNDEGKIEYEQIYLNASGEIVVQNTNAYKKQMK